MNPLDNHPFAKMNGAGNAIVVLDLRGEATEVSPSQARAIARARGLAYDQLMVLHDPRTAGMTAFMRIYNNDGSLSSACGNGTRCVAWFLTRGKDTKRLLLETDAGPLECLREGEWRFKVDMGPPRLDAARIPLLDHALDTGAVRIVAPDLPGDLPPFSAVNMGNPHAVFFVPDAAAIDLAGLGARLETDPMFPEKANISFAQILAPDHILLRVWERGAGATLACGTAACATLVAAARAGLTGRAATVTLPGGDLRIEWRESDGHVLMSGPVELEFEGAFDPAIFAGAPA